MNKKVKKLVFCGVIAICGAFMASCNDGGEENLISDAKTAAQFNSSLRENVESFMKVPVVVNSATRSIPIVNNSSVPSPTVRVYFETPSNEPIVFGQLMTAEQIFIAARETCAKLTLTDNGNNSPSVEVSEEACKEALAPLIEDSKKYLYGKGFTEAEIQEMLKENDADESELVPFVLALTEEEETNLSLENMTRCTDLDWAKIGRCALEAIGADIFAGLDKSLLKTWNKKLITKAFKTVAKRVCGPVGVAIMVVEFTICNWG